MTNTVKYVYRPGFRFPVSAMVVGSFLDALIKKYGGSVSSETVEKAARPKTSPIHPCFQWNTKRAALEHRVQQARKLLQSYMIVTVVSGGKGKERKLAFRGTYFDQDARVRGSSDLGGYVNLAELLSDDKGRQKVLEDARREMLIFRRKYSYLQELAEVIKAINDALDE